MTTEHSHDSQPTVGQTERLQAIPTDIASPSHAAPLEVADNHGTSPLQVDSRFDGDSSRQFAIPDEGASVDDAAVIEFDTTLDDEFCDEDNVGDGDFVSDSPHQEPSSTTTISGSSLLDFDDDDDDLEPPERTGSRRDKGSRTGRSPRKPAPQNYDLDEVVVPGERLQKVLASAGLASRRHCEEYILAGRVMVDGRTVTSLGVRVDTEKQKVCVDGERVKIERKRYVLVNKPPGVHCTNADPMGRTRVIDLLPPTFGRIFTVGRLDENSEGLLLVTNDGELAHKLAHPSFQVERVYRALVAGHPTDESLHQLRQGVFFEEGKFRVRDVRRIRTDGRSTVVEVVLTEGQNREVRRLFARLGHKVMKLRRIAFGPIRLGDLITGAYRPLSPVEVQVLLRFAADNSARRGRRIGSGPRSASRGDRRGPTNGRQSGARRTGSTGPGPSRLKSKGDTTRRVGPKSSKRR